jgi:DNA mismatch repair protein MutS
VLAAVCELRGACGIAACDISTGRMELEECPPEGLGAALARLARASSSPPTTGPRPPSTRSRVRARLCQRRGRGSAQGGARRRHARRLRPVHPRDARCRGGLVAYLEHTGRGRLPLLLPPVARAGGGTLAMDEATRASLEISKRKVVRGPAAARAA